MSTDRYSRQSCLGENAEEQIARCTVGVPGLGGGGSHVVQQLAHIGFKRFVLYDEDVTEESNLNRLVGATAVDAKAATPKLHLAKTMIYRLQPDAQVLGISDKWQNRPEPLRDCQVVIGCVDSYKGRHELEVACRRYLAHYVDIGMDVHGEEQHVIGGQIILSSPGGPCMWCMKFLTEERLAKEAARYGNAGPRPQVIWSNGVLASTAVGLGVDLVTNWTRACPRYAYLAYDGNEATLKPSLTLQSLGSSCPHYPTWDIGDPVVVEL